MSKGVGSNKRGPRQGSNPARVTAMQQRLQSGAYGTHKQPTDRPRSELDREAIEDYDWSNPEADEDA